MAGNTAVLKPDKQTGLTALWALALLREAGLPADVFQVVTGDGRRIGPALADRVDFLMFTGSTQTGKLVARMAADRLIGCSLELGGKNPMIVLRDADLDRTIEGAVRGCFAGAGQICVSIERIYVHESIFEEFLRRFVERVRRMRVGATLDYSIEMGSLSSEAQLETVEDHVRDALEKGATLAAGGRRRPDLGPLFFEPTVLTNVREGMKVFAEETFGPVVAVYPFATEAEAVERANASRYGLNASIWTRDAAHGVRLARRVRTGSVNVNEAYAATWGSVDSPIGGMKESGLRARHGAEGILKFTETQTVASQRLLPIAPPPWMDPAAHARWMTRLLNLLRRIRILG
jgi:acyl-CoA reductase-like NAD-dependent aldehyde dehydrogenase